MGQSCSNVLEEEVIINCDNIESLSTNFDTKELLICPDCTKCIPHIILLPYKKQMNIWIRCITTSESKVKPLNQYLKEINDIQIQTAHSVTNTDYNNQINLLKQTLNIQCNKHIKPFSLYCYSCKLNICDECQVDHSDKCETFAQLGYSIYTKHVIHLIHNLPIKNQLTEIQRIINNNTVIINRVIDKMSNEKLKHKLMSAYLINQSINQDLKQFYIKLYNTSIALYNYPTYELIQLQQAISINTNKYNYIGFNSDKKGKSLLNYLNINYVLVKEPTNKCFEVIFTHGCYITKLSDGKLMFKTNNSFEYVDPVTHKTTAETNDLIIKQWTVASIVNVFKNKQVIESYSKPQISDLLEHFYHSQYSESFWVFHQKCLIQLANGQSAYFKDNKTKLWNIHTSQEITRFHYNDDIYCLIQLKDNRLVYCCNEKNVIKLLHPITYKCNATLKGHKKKITCLLELSDNRLASGSDDTTIRIWNLTTQNCIGKLIGHSNSVERIIQLWDGRLVSSSFEYIKIWNVSLQECTATIMINYLYDLIALNDGRVACKTSFGIQIFDV